MKRILFILLLVVFIASYLVAFKFSSSPFRFRWEHGVELPASARHLNCIGSAYTLLPDRGAQSCFEMQGGEFEGFENSFKNRVYIQPTLSTIQNPLDPPADCWSDRRAFWFPNYHLFLQNKPLTKFQAKSPTGDVVGVEAYKEENSPFILVKIFTDWN